MLAAAGFNFKRMMNKYKSSLFAHFFNWLKIAIFTINELFETEMKLEPKQIISLQSKMAF